MFSEITAYVPEFALNEYLPFFVLALGGIIILALDALLDIIKKDITPDGRDTTILGATVLTILVAMGLFYVDILGESSAPFMEGSFRSDTFGNLGCLIILFGGLVFVAMSPPLIKKRKLPTGELFSLLIFALMGMTMLTVANELLTAFICIEILSLALYVIVGIDRRSRKSSEAAFKYFILGAFASAFLVLGIAFLFGGTGTTQLFGDSEETTAAMAAAKEGTGYELPLAEPSYKLGINQVLASGERIIITETAIAAVSSDGTVETVSETSTQSVPINPLWIFLGFSLILVGLCFKLSLAPFHMWAPDVYEGAPTISAMLVATASKVAAFAFLIHLIEALSFWEHFSRAALPLLTVVAALSILWGNIGALVQSNIKRMLAYSSIAHGGYIAVGIATLVTVPAFTDALAHDAVLDAILFYLFGYTLMNVIAFGIAAYLSRDGEGNMDAYRGLYQRQPLVATAMAITMISLLGLGIPGTIGFWGKYLLLKEAINADLVFLAVMTVVGSSISAYYYMRLIVQMFFQESDDGPSADVDGSVIGFGVIGTLPTKLVLIVTTAMVVFFGFIPLIFFSLVGG